MLGVAFATLLSCPGIAFEQRNMVFRLRGPYVFEYYRHHRENFEIGAVAHWAHGWQHDLILITPPERIQQADTAFAEEFLRMLENPPRTEPHQEDVAPRMARLAFRVFRTIDWAHKLHEQLYDIMTDQRISSDEKDAWIQRAIDHYLSETDVAFSVAPTEQVLRRGGLHDAEWMHDYPMHWPRANDMFYALHWWHIVVYEAQLLYPELEAQQTALRRIAELLHTEVLELPPNRMLFTRETAPRWARRCPEAANVFDNLHMYHHMVYSILQSEEIEDKRSELYRITDLMLNQPGDRERAGEFEPPYPDMDPLVYAPWMYTGRGVEGEVLPEMHMDHSAPEEHEHH